mgnify:CR=1 FL=1
MPRIVVAGLATFALPGSAGVPAAVAAHTLVLPYNDLDAVRDAFAAHPNRIAAVITEAAGANAGVLAPLPGFNGALALVAKRFRVVNAAGASDLQDTLLVFTPNAQNGYDVTSAVVPITVTRVPSGTRS